MIETKIKIMDGDNDCNRKIPHENETSVWNRINQNTKQ